MSLSNFHKFLLESKKISRLNEEDGDLKEDGSYLSCLSQALSGIDRMISVIGSADPEAVSEFLSKKREIGDDLDETTKSHMDMWKSLDSLAVSLQNSIENADLWQEKEVDEEGPKKKIKTLTDQRDRGEIDDEEFRKLLQREKTGVTAAQAKNIFFEKTKKAFSFFRQAVRYFAACGQAMLKSQKDPSWIEASTSSAKKMLRKK